jgi:hypothetical protein
MDLAVILRRPLNDPNWLTTCLKAGVLVCVPVANIAALGWSKRVYAQYRASGNDVLPDPFEDIGGDLALGFSAFVAILGGLLPMYAVAFGLFCCGFGVDLAGGMGLGTMLANLAVLPLSLLAGALGPAALWVHLRTGDLWVWAHASRALAVLKGDSHRFMILCVAMFVANIVSSAGVAACCVGLVLTVPLAMAMSSSALAAFDEGAAAF